MLLDVLFHGGRVRRAADVVESLGVSNAKSLAQRSAASEDELADVAAICRDVIVAKERQFLAALGEFGSQSRAVIPRWAFRPVRPVGIDHLVRAHRSRPRSG